MAIQPLRRKHEGLRQWRVGPVGPFACNTEAPALQPSEDQRVDIGYSSFLEYFEALAPKRMERMTDFCPSQMRTAIKCSSR